MIKIACVSHSNISIRQRLFWKVMSKYTNVLVIAPKQWYNLSCESIKEGNYELFADEVYKAGDMFGFILTKEAVQKIKDFKPDIIYNQNEIYAYNTRIVRDLADELKCKLATFCWENIRSPNIDDEEIIYDCDLIICGNSKSKELHNGDLVLPQVGINTEEFKPNNDKTIDVAFFGRNVYEKGVEYIKIAYPNTLFVNDKPYEEVRELMKKTKIAVSYPYDTKSWKEQFLPYSTAESMASGCCIITSDAESIKEWAEGSPAIIIPMHRPDLLKEEIEKLLKDEKRIKKLSAEGIEWVKRFDNEEVAKKLLEVFNKILK